MYDRRCKKKRMRGTESNKQKELKLFQAFDLDLFEIFRLLVVTHEGRTPTRTA
jgi:hypothetical protein